MHDKNMQQKYILCLKISENELHELYVTLMSYSATTK